MEDLLVPSRPKHIECEEDDEFQAMFDKMMNDNIAETRATGKTGGGGQLLSLVAPTSTKHKKNYGTGSCSSSKLNQQSCYNNFCFIDQLEPAAEDTVQFSVLLRKNNKPSYREMAVPKESEIARNLQKQEEADRLEKERVKKLTLEINERQEEEEVNEAIAAVSSAKKTNSFFNHVTMY